MTSATETAHEGHLHVTNGWQWVLDACRRGDTSQDWTHYIDTWDGEFTAPCPCGRDVVWSAHVVGRLGPCECTGD